MSKSRYSKLMQDLLQNMFEGFVLDENKKLKIVNEAAAQHTADVIHKIVLEKSRELWESFESAEASLRSAAAEINFEELNADVSNMGRQSAGEVSIEDLTNMEGAQTMESTQSLKKVLGTDDFDLSSIFESLDHLDSDDADGDSGDRHLTDEGEGMMMDAEDDEELDGDEEFTKLQVGGDDAEMGGEAGEGDMEPDEYGDENGDDLGMDDADELEIEPENGEMDDEMGMEPELGGDELDGEPMGDEEALDFDFDSLGDLGDEEDEMEEMMGGQMRMESEGEDDDKDDDDDDDDKDDDDKDDDDDKPAFLKDKD